MIGDKIEELRKSKGMTQEELGEKLATSPSTIGMYEQNRRTPDIYKFASVAEIFGVSTDYLLGIHNNSLMLAVLLENIRHTQQAVEAVDGEEIEVTLTNTKDFYFNNSVKTVALSTMRNSLDYRVMTEIQGNPVNVGDVVVYDKQVNGFKIAFTGSAESVTVRCFVQGGGTI